MIYFDNSATTPLLPQSRVAILEALLNFGNPSSLHALGFRAHEVLEGSRRDILEAVTGKKNPSGRIIFTASGTEADNLAILGSMRAKEKRRSGTAVLSCDAEHPAVENTLCELEKEGFKVFRIPTRGGVLDLDYAREVIEHETVSLVTLMLVNNETGSLFDVGSVFRMAKEKNPETMTHTDAVQGFLKVPIDPPALGADMITLSSHKIHGPKGVGALYVSEEIMKKRDLSPVIFGGGQEASIRSGTENVPGIAGFAAAAKYMRENEQAFTETVRTVSEYLQKGLADLGLRVNRAPVSADHILSVTLPGIRGETMVHFLSSKDICVSSGSACSSRSGHKSRSLGPFGLSKTDADSTIRISLSHLNTTQEADVLLQALEDGIGTLVRSKAGSKARKPEGRENSALIAMSGGVDSSVAAYLMVQKGFRCTGATMRLYNAGETAQRKGSCCSLDDVDDARAVAVKLNMPFEVLDYTEDFKHRIIEKFISVYEAGGTPNPCIDCNRFMKFDKLMAFADERGISRIVTGHYARISFDEPSGRYLLLKAADPGKDQSYVLYMLTQRQLSRIVFPLGGMHKSEVRELAQANGFSNAHKHDSQDICFVPDGDYVSFMSAYTGKDYPCGDFLDESGRVIGTHRGAVRYTTGQRKGLGIALGEPAYVIGKDMEKNTVTIGKNESLFADTLIAEDLNWISIPELSAPMRVSAKARYRHEEQPGTLYPLPDGRVRFVFDEPQRALTAGQAAVFYDGDIVVGGGTICEIQNSK